MLEVNFYDEVDDSLLKFAVIISKADGKWVFCKHKERDTYEIPGGHREEGELILDTAKRELREETGAIDFNIKEEIDLVPALREYYMRHMADGTFVSWLAWDGENIIGTSGMSFVEKPPYFGCPSGKMGLLSSMYTNPKYRRMGIARELLSRVVNDAREYGCGTIQITASDMGVKLYADFGFVYNGNFMQYKL